MKSVAVYCGASPGLRPEYLQSAAEVGRNLAQRGIRLIYGGGAVGMMGTVADACLEAGGEVVGVITEQLQDLEVGHDGLTRLHVVKNMHQRKAMMAELADGFVALPGGIGTLEEMFEVFTWAQLELHVKPCGLLNVCGYYDHLHQFLKHVVEERFLLPEHGGMLLLDDDFDQLHQKMMDHEPPRLEKWVDRKIRGEG